MAKEKKKNSFWGDFKAFISRGSILDMATGVVIGGAFGKIVTGLVNYILNPFIGIFTKGAGLDGLKTVIAPAVTDASGAVTTAETAILWGTWLQTIIDFIIVAFCIFTILRVIMKAKNVLDAKKLDEEKQKADAAAAKAAADKAAAEKAAADAVAKQAELDASLLRQEKLLSEIRDILAKK